MAGLESWAHFAEIVSALVVLGGVTYGVAEWRELRRRRIDFGAEQIVRSFQSPAWIEATRVLWRLPDDAPPATVAADAEVERGALTVAAYCHTIGYMVYKGTMPLAVLREFETGTVAVSWRKTRQWAKAVERRAGQPTFRWFEWLALELGAAPAAAPPAAAHPAPAE